MKQANKLILSINLDNQILDYILNSDNFDALQRPEIPIAVAKLKEAKNVKLNSYNG